MQASDAPLPPWTFGSRRLLAAMVVVKAFAFERTMFLTAGTLATIWALATLDQVDAPPTIALWLIVSALAGCVLAPWFLVGFVLLRSAEWHIRTEEVREGRHEGQQVIAVLATRPAGPWTEAHWFAVSRRHTRVGRELGRRVRDQAHAEGRPLRITAWPSMAQKYEEEGMVITRRPLLGLLGMVRLEDQRPLPERTQR